MRCFNHADNRAVGLCKWCLKGVCPDCLTESVDGLACKHGDCAEKASLLNEYNLLAIKNGKKVLTGQPAIWGILGIALLAMGVSFSFTSAAGPLSWVMMVIGLIWIFKAFKKQG